MTPIICTPGGNCIGWLIGAAGFAPVTYATTENGPWCARLVPADDSALAGKAPRGHSLPVDAYATTPESQILTAAAAPLDLSGVMLLRSGQCACVIVHQTRDPAQPSPVPIAAADLLLLSAIAAIVAPKALAAAARLATRVSSRSPQTQGTC